MKTNETANTKVICFNILSPEELYRELSESFGSLQITEEPEQNPKNG